MVFNFVYQVIYLLWINQWLINKDEHKCIVNKEKNYPIIYQTEEEYKKIMNDPSAVDVSKKFTQVFTYSLFTYIALDIDLVLALWQYRKSVLDYSFRPNFKCVLCLFIYFVFFGVVELIMIVALRFTREGRVCSGAYLLDNDPEYNTDTADYYMTYEGKFVIIVALQEALQVATYLILYRKVNAQRPKDIDIFKTYIAPSMYMPYSKATQLILD